VGGETLELIQDYLDDLDSELAELPRAARREVVAEISAHIDELRTELSQRRRRHMSASCSTGWAIPRPRCRGA
jgi:hypothetical protein